MGQAQVAPMKAPSASANIATLHYPLYASRKLDGLRALHDGNTLRSKTWKRFPNKHVNELFRGVKLHGLDGELVVGAPNSASAIRITTSGVMSVAGEPDVWYWVFDDYTDPHLPFNFRYTALCERVRRLRHPAIKVVQHKLVPGPSDLQMLEDRVLKEGFEGLMLRASNGPYKFGQSTPTEGYLWKLKRFVDSEAYLIRVEEGHTNTNEGRTSHLKGMVPNGMVGTLIGVDVKTGMEIRCAPGKLTQDERRELMSMKITTKKLMFTYRHFPTGTVNAPRFPTWQAWRHPSNL